MEESDILIVGSGIFGLSTAVHLASSSNHPQKVTLLDARPYDPPQNRGGASNDINKIVRADYEDAFYMELAYEALDAWNSDPEFVDAQVFHRTGWVVLPPRNYDTTPATTSDSVGPQRLSSSTTHRIRENFRDSSRPDPTVDLTMDDIRDKWGGVLAKSDFELYEPAYFNPVPGWVDVPRAMSIMSGKALKGGLKYEVDEVQGLILDDDNAAVKGVRCKSGKVYGAKKVLLATGAWTSQLMAPLEDELGLPDDQRIESQVSAYAVCVAQFRLSPEEREMYGKIPVSIYGDEADLIPPTNDGILKFNTVKFQNTCVTGSGRKITAPLDQDQGIIPDNVKERATARIKSVTPQLLEGGRSVDIWRACWDCRTEDRNMLITRHPNPKLSNLYLAMGGSSHSWKFLPIIGKYVANMLNGVSNGEEKDRRWTWKARGAPSPGVLGRNLRD